MSEQSSEQILRGLATAIAEAANRVYADWVQDEQGESVKYGYGGICDDVAAAICEVVDRAGVAEDVRTYHISDDNHTVALVLMPDGIFEVDIPHRTYETGSFYRYRKRPDITIEADDVVVSKLTDDGSEWNAYVDG